jgi:hypothetical protein
MPNNSTNKCPECKHEVLVHGSGSSTHTHCGDSLGYELICSCPTCKGTGIAPEPVPSSQRDELDTIFSTLNGQGAHSCDCPRSTDSGCKCALKDEYLAEAKAAIHHQTQIAQMRYALEVLGEITKPCEYMDVEDYAATMQQTLQAVIQAQQTRLDELTGEKK